MCTLVKVRLCESRRTAREYSHSFGTGNEDAGIERGSRLGRLGALGAAALWRRALGKLDNHQTRHKDLDTMRVEIDGRAVRFGFGNHAATVLKMLDVLACREILQNFLLSIYESKS